MRLKPNSNLHVNQLLPQRGEQVRQIAMENIGAIFEKNLKRQYAFYMNCSLYLVVFARNIAAYIMKNKTIRTVSEILQFSQPFRMVWRLLCLVLSVCLSVCVSVYKRCTHISSQLPPFSKLIPIPYKSKLTEVLHLAISR